MNAKQQLYFSFPELRYGLLEYNSKTNCQYLTNWTRWNKRDKVWRSTISLLSDVFVAVGASLLLKLPNIWRRVELTALIEVSQLVLLSKILWHFFLITYTPSCFPLSRSLFAYLYRLNTKIRNATFKWFWTIILLGAPELSLFPASKALSRDCISFFANRF